MHRLESRVVVCIVIRILKAVALRSAAFRLLHTLPVVHIAVKSLAVEAVIILFHVLHLPFFFVIV